MGAGNEKENEKLEHQQESEQQQHQRSEQVRERGQQHNLQGGVGSAWTLGNNSVWEVPFTPCSVPIRGACFVCLIQCLPINRFKFFLLLKAMF